MKTKTNRKSVWFILTALVLSLFPAGIPKAYAVQYQFNDAYLMLSDSNPASEADWTLQIKNVQAIPADGKIVITPQDSEFTIDAAMDFEDLDLYIGGEITLAASPGSGASSAWGVSVTSGSSGSITLTNNDTDVIAADSTIVIEIGTIATTGASGAEQITNPSKDAATGTADIWTVDVTSKTSGDVVIDTIDLLVACIEDIDVYGSQKPQMTMTITGDTAPSGGAIDANYIEWKEVTPGTPKTAIMQVKVNTDAKDGFTVYVYQNHNMQHSEDSGIDIDAWSGTNASPSAWSSPNGTTIGVNTGYLGYHTSDATLGTGTADRFTGADTWAGLGNGSTNQGEILYHSAATQSDVDGQDRADVTFKIETNNLQPSGNYSNEITFIAKPIF